MAKRWIRIEIDDDPLEDCDFIDLAHALWSVARVAVDDVTVSVDGTVDVDAYNERWAEHGRESPWG